MSSIMSSLLLLLCLSIHACSGRHLGVIDEESGRQVQNLSAKDVEKAILDETSISSNVKKPSLSKELPTRQRLTNRDGASTQKPKNSHEEAYLNEVGESKGTTIPGVVRIESLVSVSWPVPHEKHGSEIIISSDDVGLQQSTKIEGSERRARSVLGSGFHVTEETIDSKENGVVEDVVVMDYEQPHRKPPIHNLSP